MDARILTTLPMLLAAALTACSDPEPSTAVKPAPDKGGAPVDPAGAGTGTPRRTDPKPAREFQPAAPLTRDVAEGVLRGALANLDEDDPSRQAVLYLADLGDRQVVNPIHTRMLARDDGEWESTEAAAAGFEALMRLGEADSAAQLVELGRYALADEAFTVGMLAQALGAVKGEHAGAADEILAALALYEDDEEGAYFAVRELARRRSEAGRETFVRIVGDQETWPDVNVAAAVAGLLGLGDPRGAEAADSLVRRSAEDIEGDAVILGLGVRGITEADPYVRAVLDQAIADETEAWEASAACAALSDIHMDAPDAGAVAYIRGILDQGLAEGEAAAALFALGEDDVIPLVASEIKFGVVAVNESDPEDQILILESVARRKLAHHPDLRVAVDAAAQVTPAADAHPSVAERALSLRLAAAYAWLKSQ